MTNSAQERIAEMLERFNEKHGIVCIETGECSPKERLMKLAAIIMEALEQATNAGSVGYRYHTLGADKAIIERGVNAGIEILEK